MQEMERRCTEVGPIAPNLKYNKANKSEDHPKLTSLTNVQQISQVLQIYNKSHTIVKISQLYKFHKSNKSHTIVKISQVSQITTNLTPYSKNLTSLTP